ncbi:S8 family serine peptidase [Salininema proteolyticum]|uniref:S8 family serine peptidase n=1 Tax=Salininema proteolyticum TaxID=1607685 RepID=A0ABV8TYN1_9ACTN
MVKRHRARRTLSVFAAAATAAAASAAFAPSASAAEGEIRGAEASDAIADSYIVVMEDGLSTQSAENAFSTYDASVDRTFSTINGYSVSMSEKDAKALAADPAVDYVEANRTMRATGTQTNPPSWGLDRLDQDSLPLDDSYTYPDSGGAGVTSYIIDTGIDIAHSDFGGRASHGYDFVDNDGDATDCNGHGTHVAGTVGSDSYGLAKSSDLVGVRVLDCGGSGTYEGVIAGIDWVTQNAVQPATANMSLGGGFSQAVNDAVSASIASGVTYAVASGNDNSDACNYSPASTPEALTTNSSTSSDGRSSFSNYGTCTDIFGPGSSITSTWLNGGTNTISGTSMASPHVAGAATLHLGEFPGDSPAQVESALKDNAVSGAISNPGSGSPNLLVNTNYLNGAPVEDDFSVSVDPSEGQVAPGESVSATVATETTRGADQDVTLSASGLPEGVTATFDPENVTTGGTSALTLSASADAAEGDYTVTVTASGSIDRSATFALRVGEGDGNTPPEASFTDDCWGFFGICSFDGSASSDADGSIVSYEWDFGDGNTGTGASTYHFYSSAGTYEVTLTVTDDQGATGSVTRTVNA